MSEKSLKDKRIAMLATDGYEQSELEVPLTRLRNEGATVDIISLEPGKIRAWSKGNWTDSTVDVTHTVDQVDSDDYDGLVIPGGVINPDRMRQNHAAVEFVKGFFKTGVQRPVASICHGPWMLVEAGVIKGREVTSYPSLRTDIINSGAMWVDKEVVVDNGLVTSRNPGDLDAFVDAILEEFQEGDHREVRIISGKDELERHSEL